jgi:hypothetical protein
MTDSHWGKFLDDPFEERREGVNVDDNLLLRKAKEEWADKERAALRARYACVDVPHGKLASLYKCHVEIDRELRKATRHYFFDGKPTFIAIIKGDMRRQGFDTYLFDNDEDAAEFMLRYL